ncbi:MAG: AmmeMemoRadiSam system protein B [Chlorobi bacterium]|nr:AmmeMemoRadiSam system protein B [Chlorobiota bacterium]
MDIRKPAVAGRFYPSDPDELKDMIRTLDENKSFPCSREGKALSSGGKILGSVVPHAGYIFSGPHAVCFFKLLRERKISFDTAVIIHPLHVSWGGSCVTDDHDAWETPLGVVELDLEFISNIKIPASRNAHAQEHSAEVMVPFLQYFAGNPFRIVPLGMQDQTPEEAENIAHRIFDTEKKLLRRVLIVASSDFSHYIDPDTGYRKDQLVLDEIFNMEPASVYRVIHEKNVSACGYGPIMTLIHYAKLQCEIPEITVLSRGHSGQVHPSHEVVDYISILFACS